MVPSSQNATDRPRVSFTDLLTHKPFIHGGRSITWHIHPALATFLDDYVQPAHVTLETGSGFRTLVILRKGVARHIAIAPEPDEFAVIREYSAENGVSTEILEAVAMNSQQYLPVAELPLFDLVLIDGDHAFPSPFIDWYYTADRLAIGGLMIVDDIQLITGRLLTDFMDADPKWDRVLYEPSRGAYRKVRHPIHEGHWPKQPYVADSNPVQDVTIVRAVSDLPEASRVHPVLLNIYARLPSPVQGSYRTLRHLYRLIRG
jgi:predicted O-methyltransferase YrrM